MENYTSRVEQRRNCWGSDDKIDGLQTDLSMSIGQQRPDRRPGDALLDPTMSLVSTQDGRSQETEVFLVQRASHSLQSTNHAHSQQ